LLAALNSAQSGIRSSRAVFQSFKPETRLDEVRALASFFEVKH
jgi:hypothetical protein